MNGLQIGLLIMSDYQFTISVLPTEMQCFNYNFIEKYIFRAKFGVCSVYFVTFHSYVIVYIHLDLIWNNLSRPPYHVLPPLIQPYSMDKLFYLKIISAA